MSNKLIIQIATNKDGAVYGLCDDGSLLCVHKGEWSECVDSPNLDKTEIETYRDLCVELLSSLKDMVQIDCPLIGSPSKEDLLDFWEHEKSQGRGIAGEMLTALNAITKAEAIMGENSNG